MPIVDLPDCLLENTKHGPRQWLCSILPFEEAIQEFNPSEYYLSPFSYEQNGQHSSVKKKKRKEKKNTILFCRSGPACDNPNPLLEY